MNMPPYPSWQNRCVRLALTTIAGAIIGSNRGSLLEAAGIIRSALDLRRVVSEDYQTVLTEVKSCAL
jgi:hypothetical protein